MGQFQCFSFSVVNITLSRSYSACEEIMRFIVNELVNRVVTMVTSIILHYYWSKLS